MSFLHTLDIKDASTQQCPGLSYFHKIRSIVLCYAFLSVEDSKDLFLQEKLTIISCSIVIRKIFFSINEAPDN